MSQVQHSMWDLDTPALIIDLDVMERNVERMAAFFADKPAKLRPHFKAHKCVDLARRQIAAGAIGMTVQKVGEAEVLVEAGGFDDILIANQIVGKQKIERLMRVAKRTQLTVAVDSAENVRDLASAADAASEPLNLLVEVDVGMGRCGVRRVEDAVALAEQIEEAEFLNFAGVMGYEGHAVLIAGRDERYAAARAAMARLIAARDAVIAAGIPVRTVSSGGTGTFDVSGTYPGVTEIQAGSYIMMDAKYAGLGLEFATALSCLVTVVSRPEPDLAITDAGRKSITEEFGLAPCLDLPRAVTVRSSEEHGHIKLNGHAAKIGDKVRMVPTHICTTVNLHDRFYAVRNGALEAVYEIGARGKAQ